MYMCNKEYGCYIYTGVIYNQMEDNKSFVFVLRWNFSLTNHIPLYALVLK